MATDIPQKIRDAVHERACPIYGNQPHCEAYIVGVCAYYPTHWHHRKMRSQGGKHEVANGLYVCHRCHSYIHSNPTLSYLNGWLVRGVDDPAAIPVLRRGKLVLLGEDGSVQEVKND